MTRDSGTVALATSIKDARSIYCNPKSDKPVDIIKSFEITLGGPNMFTQPNKEAMVTRLSTSKAFASREVERMKAVCDHHIDKWIESILKPAVDAETIIDPCQEMIYVAFSIICEVIFEYVATREECDLFQAHNKVTSTEVSFCRAFEALSQTLLKRI